MSTGTTFHIEKPKHGTTTGWHPATFRCGELTGHPGTWVTRVEDECNNCFSLFSSKEDAQRLAFTILRATGLPELEFEAKNVPVELETEEPPF